MGEMTSPLRKNVPRRCRLTLNPPTLLYERRLFAQLRGHWVKHMQASKQKLRLVVNASEIARNRLDNGVRLPDIVVHSWVSERKTTPYQLHACPNVACGGRTWLLS